MGSAGRTGPIGVLSAVSPKTAEFDASRQLLIMHSQPHHKIVDFHTRTPVSRSSDSIHCHASKAIYTLRAPLAIQVKVRTPNSSMLKCS